MEIIPPHPLAKLPRSTRPDAIPQFAVVSASRQGIRRRRQEICAAIDGDSLSLYELNNGSILASYPVPPASSFSGPPVSTVEKQDGSIHRRTYCAIKRDTLKIQYFQSQDQDPHQPKAITSTDLNQQYSDIVLLDLISGANDQQKQVFVLQQDGTITIFSEDLAQTITETSISTTKSMRILAAQHLSGTEAGKSVLKQRPDLVNAAAPNASYLAVVYTTSNDRQVNLEKLYYAVYAIEESTRDDRVRSLSECSLGMNGRETKSIDVKSVSCTFSSSVSHLHLRFGGSLFTYALSGILPQQTSVLHTGFTGPSEILAISPVFAISSHQRNLRLFDLKYQTTQAHVDPSRSALKRKRNQSGAEPPIEFVTYIPKLARIVGKCRNQLVAIDIIAKEDPKRLLRVGSNLIQNIGQTIMASDSHYEMKTGLKNLTIGTIGQGNTSDDEWQNSRRQLDQLAQRGDVAGFEDAFIYEVRKPYLALSYTGNMDDDFPAASIPDVKSKYLLTKIFRLETASAGDRPTHANIILRVQLPSVRLILWLSRLGLLSTRLVQTAMHGTTPYAMGEFLQPGAVAQALLALDPTLQLLQKCIENGFSHYVDEQAATVHMLITQALSFPGDEIEDQGNGAPSHEVIKLAETQLQTTGDDSQTSWVPEQVKQALVAALNRFGSAAVSTVTPILKKSFSQTEILALIQLLRQQLFQGGHTQSFRTLALLETDDKVVVSLEAVVRVLSCCIDSIGPLGLIGTIDNEAFVDSIIPDLLSEIASTKESLEDAAELQGILRETLRFHESFQRNRKGDARSNLGAGKELKQQPGTIVTLYSDLGEGMDGPGEGRSLPLSLGVDTAISSHKVRKGGGQILRRSAREKNMLRQRQKGPYSFERLVL
ncbi:hypothetical protein LTR84_010626 [Exophiala bonariae]|uniref:Utp8 beta-propeller domain-containing protein n=1 Tax=Exophiala bonariae TaxID=1690606 RepID=A0AAV9MSY2_9EURO|nr:hypothetical protein LTR84_010626 [Exophiala bonariae]